MANKCFQTKLKAVVDNDDLKVLGYITAKVKNGTIKLGSTSLVTGIAVNGVWSDTSTTERSNFSFYVNHTAITTSEENVIARIPNYHIKDLLVNGLADSIETFDLDDLVNSDASTLTLSLNYANLKGSGNGLATKFTEVVQLLNCTFSNFDLTGLGSNGGVTKFYANTASGLKGDISSLAYSTLVDMRWPSNSYGDGNSLSFDPVHFVKIKRKIGETTGTFSVQYLGAIDVYFNGHKVLNQQSNTLSWTANTITLNGETIDNSEIEP